MYYIFIYIIVSAYKSKITMTYNEKMYKQLMTNSFKPYNFFLESNDIYAIVTYIYALIKNNIC